MSRLPRSRHAPAVAVAITALVTAVVSALAAPPLGAQLLVPSMAGGRVGATSTDLTSLLSDLDDGLVTRAFANPFTFYGRGYGSLAITTNGYLQFAGDPAYVRSAARTLPELAEALGAPVVAPLYDDLVFDDRSALVEDVAPDHFQAYTYRDVLGFGDPSSAGGRSTFQVAFFTGLTRIGAFDFLAGDVALSYDVVGHTPAGDAVAAGLARDGLAFAAHPEAAADGTMLAGGAFGATPMRTAVFRPDGNGGYDASLVPAVGPSSEPPVTTTPEPPAAVCLAVGLAVAAAVARRRRRT